MQMDGNSFELLMQEVLKHKQIMEELEAENRDLLRQLAALRAGQNVVVDILGKRFPLTGEPVVPPQEISTVQNFPDVPPTVADINQPTIILPVITETLQSSFAQMPQPEQTEEESATSPAPTFLEELPTDEFTSAVTNPIAIWPGRETKSEPQPTNEEEKAALRQQLIGSFLLE